LIEFSDHIKLRKQNNQISTNVFFDSLQDLLQKLLFVELYLILLKPEDEILNSLHYIMQIVIFYLINVFLNISLNSLLVFKSLNTIIDDDEGNYFVSFIILIIKKNIDWGSIFIFHFSCLFFLLLKTLFKIKKEFFINFDVELRNSIILSKISKVKAPKYSSSKIISHLLAVSIVSSNFVFICRLI
jgi:hypothetical protein